MSRSIRRSDRVIAVVLAVVMALSIPAVFATAGVAAPDAPDPDADDTTTGEASADNTTGEASADTTSPTDASVWETADTALADKQGDASLARAQLDLVQDLEAIATDSSRSQRDQALDMADTVLEQRKGWAASEGKPLSPSMVPKFEAQQTNLNGARRLLETNEELQDAEGLARAVPLAKLGTKLQAAQADDSITMNSDLPAVETLDHASPSAATQELMERYGVTPTAEDRAAMQALDDLPEPSRSELTDFLDAFLAFQRTTTEGDVTRVFAARNRLLDETKDLNDAIENTDGPGLATPQHTSPIDNNTLSSSPTRVGCVDKTVGANQDIDGKYPSAIPGGDSDDDINNQTYHFCVLQIDNGSDDTYRHNTVVLIDTAGSDTYNMNAGGTNLDDSSDGPIAVDHPGGDTCPIMFTGIGPSNDCDKTQPINNRLDVDVAAALVDLGSGNDDYTRSDHPGIGFGQRGGAAIGSGFLVDDGGSDEYGEKAAYNNASDGVNGGASGQLPSEQDCCRNAFATGFLLDAGSNSNTEPYRAGKFGTNGGGSKGGKRVYGFLMDTGGKSTYTASWQGVNGGAGGGNGFLADLGTSSDDTYKAAGYGTNGGAQFGLGFLPPNCVCSRGYLLDAGGSGDEYIAGSQGTNGGANQEAVGFLLDDGSGNSGTDTFQAGRTENASELLNSNPGSFETNGKGSLAGYVGVNGGAFEAAVGTLIDTGGLTEYTTGDGRGANGGAYEASAGLIVDNGAGDTYTAGDTSVSPASAADLRDANKPHVSAGSNGGGAIAGVGAIVDPDGGNDYIAKDGHTGGINGTNGGAWSLGQGGVGLVASADGTDTYKATSANGPVTGANGGGSGFGEFVASGPIESTERLIPGDQNISVSATRATGTLVDNDGKGDKYVADATGAGSTNPSAGVNGGAFGNTSVGVLVDTEGKKDNYTAIDDSSNTSEGQNGGVNATTGVGLLLDGSGGEDKYVSDYCSGSSPSSPLKDDTIFPKGYGIAGKGTAIAGAQIDSSSVLTQSEWGCGTNTGPV